MFSRLKTKIVQNVIHSKCLEIPKSVNVELTAVNKNELFYK